MNKYIRVPYRDYAKHCKKIREYYGYNSSQMSRLLGFGLNQWANYEKGHEPSESNALLIELIADPEVWLKVIKMRAKIINSETT